MNQAKLQAMSILSAQPGYWDSIDWDAVDVPAVILALMFDTDPRLDWVANPADMDCFHEIADNMNDATVKVHIGEWEANADLSW
jgi:hypothetical protein